MDIKLTHKGTEINGKLVKTSLRSADEKKHIADIIKKALFD